MRKMFPGAQGEAIVPQVPKFMDEIDDIETWTVLREIDEQALARVRRSLWRVN
jgi:hypothetical protein